MDNETELKRATRCAREVGTLHPTLISRAPIGKYLTYEDQHIRLRICEQRTLDDYEIWTSDPDSRAWTLVLRWSPYGQSPAAPDVFCPGQWLRYLEWIASARTRALLNWRAEHWDWRTAASVRPPLLSGPDFAKEQIVAEGQVIIATDGCCLSSGYGGWAFILQHDGIEHLAFGSLLSTSADIAELTAIFEALRYTQERGWLAAQYPVRVFTDYQRAVQRFCKTALRRRPVTGWAAPGSRQAVILLDKIYSFLESGAVDWTWIKGHCGNLDNRRVDSLARIAAGGCSSHLYDAAGLSPHEWAGLKRGSPKGSTHRWNSASHLERPA